MGIEQDIVEHGAVIEATGSGLALSSEPLASTHNATRITGSVGLTYDIASAKRLGANLALNQSAYLSTPTASALLSFTAGF